MMLCYSLGWRLCLLFLFVFRTANSFEVTNTVSPLVTRSGCVVVLMCGGFGDSIEWKRFGDVGPLQDNENQRILTREIAVENMTVPYLVAQATLTAHPGLDNQRFQCFVRGSPPGGRTITHQVLLRVNSEVVAIDPPIREQWDLSNYSVGDDVSIGCSVQTCAEQVTVQFLKGAKVVGQFPDWESGMSTNSYVLTLKASEDIRGTYACKVDTASSAPPAMQTFEIIGSPLPTTAPPTAGTASNGGGEGGDPSEGEGDDRSSAVPVVSLPPSLLLAALLGAVLHWL